MNTYLTSLKVTALREIAKRIGFRFISRYRKAELIALIIAEIDACHIEAIREDKIRTRQNAPTVSLMDYPVPYGRVVTEAHVKICRERGCVSYVKNGMDMGFCPRCGEVTTSEEQITEESISDGIVIAPTEIQIPAMLSEYGYSAHGNTYAVDYNRIHEEMQNRQAEANVDSVKEGFFPNGDPRNFDSLNALTVMVNALTPLADMALAACEATATGPVRDVHYQAYLDLSRAADEMRRSLAFFEDMR